MFKLKGFLGLVLILVIVMAMIVPAQAANRRKGLRSTGAITASTASVLGAGKWVYGWTIFANAASARAALMDNTTLGVLTLTASEVVDEIGEATQYDTAEKWFAEPIYFVNGVTVQVTVGTIIIHYGPQP